MSSTEEMLDAEWLDSPMGGAIVDGFDRGILCVTCLKPTDNFFVVLGSDQFFQAVLRSLKVDGPPAIRRMIQERGNPVRKITACVLCSAAAGLGRPSSLQSSMLLSGGDTSKPVPVTFLAETEAIMRDFQARIQREQKIRARREEKDMRVAGAQKDMRELIAELTDKDRKPRPYFVRIDGKNHAGIFRDEEGGPRIATVSMSPHNPQRAVHYVMTKVKRWEEANIPEETEMAPRTVRGPYNMRDEIAKAAIIQRYDAASAEARKELLAREGIRHETIRRWRGELQQSGTFDVPLPEQPDESRMCVQCGRDKALTRENFTQITDKRGQLAWSSKCIACTEGRDDCDAPKVVIPPVTSKDGHQRAAEAVPAPERVTIDDDDAKMVRLARRKREIGMRLGEIEDEKARLVRELDEEKAHLLAEKDEVETALLDLVTG